MTSDADRIVELYERHATEWDRRGGHTVWLARSTIARP